MHVDDIPSELLATAFEIGVLTCGIQFLPPICLVCKIWNSIVNQHPRLWGIVDVARHSTSHRLLTQISKVKAAPLTVVLSPSPDYANRGFPKAIDQLLDLSENWISATLPAGIFSRRAWPQMYPHLQQLVLLWSNGHLNSPSIPEPRPSHNPPRLLTLSVERLGPEWVTPFLSPSIETFSYTYNPARQVPAHETPSHLAQIPNVRTLTLIDLNHKPGPQTHTTPVCLPLLNSLELIRPSAPSLLPFLAAPALQTLTIVSVKSYYYHASRTPLWGRSLAPALSQWCDAAFVPTNLHTLHLVECLMPTDIPFLVRFLARVPNLVRLTIIDDVIGEDKDAHLISALASPTELICPSLMILHLEAVDLDAGTLVEIASLRGIHSTQDPQIPKHLRRVLGFICSGGEGYDGEMRQLKKLVEAPRL